MTRPASTTSEHSFPGVEERLRENPAAFLTKTTREETALAVIAGIETAERARAWIAIERRLGKIHDREPRSMILDALEAAEERARFETVDDRREWYDELEIEVVEEEPEPEVPTLWRHEECETLNVEKEPQEVGETWYCHTCDVRTNRVDEVDPDAISIDDLPDAQVTLARADGGSGEGSA